MAEYASKGVAGSGLGLGIAGTALGLLNNANGGGGLLGGLLGGGWNNQAAQMANAAGLNAMAQKDAEIARLKAEKYSDKSDVEVYAQTRRENQDLGDRILGNWIKPIAQESAANRERLATLEAKVDGNKALTDKDMLLLRKDVEISTLQGKLGIQALDNKVDVVALTARNGIEANAGAIAALKNTVDGIVCTKVCKDSICPEVMPRWNAWEAPTAVAPATQPVTGTINVAN